MSSRVRLSVVFASAIAAALTCIYWVSCARSLGANFPTWVDGPILGIMRAFQSGRVYQPDGQTQMPYTVLTHTPLSYAIGHMLYRIWPGFAVLRLLNMLVTLGCAGLISVWTWRETKNSPAAILAPSAFLLSPAVFHWSQVTRSPDAFACFFSLLCLSLAAREGNRNHFRLGVCCALAFVSKQSSVLILAPTLVAWDVISGRWRESWKWIAVAGTLGGTFLVTMQLRTNGGFWTNIVTANMCRMTWQQMLYIAINLWFYVPFLLVVWRVSRPRNTLAHVWCAVAFLVGLVTCRKLGSDTMYFFDCSAAAAVLAGVALARATNVARAIGLTVCLSLFAGITDVNLMKTTSREAADGFAGLLAYLRPKATVLSDEASVAMLAGKQWYWDDPFVMNELTRHGKWDPGPLVREIEARSFSAIVVRFPRNWPDAGYAAIEKGYRKDRSFQAFDGEYQVYVPIGQ